MQLLDPFIIMILIAAIAMVIFLIFSTIIMYLTDKLGKWYDRRKNCQHLKIEWRHKRSDKLNYYPYCIECHRFVEL